LIFCSRKLFEKFNPFVIVI